MLNHVFHDPALAEMAAVATALDATMASTQSWSEANGAGGTTLTTGRTETNWKNIDDSTTAYTASPVSAGSNSFDKVQALLFAGTWNSLSALTYKCSTNAPSTGVSLVGSVVTTAATAATTATGDSALSTSGITSGFGTSSTPFSTAGGSSSTASGTLYANALRTQIQTTSGAGPGDIPTVTITASWTES